MTEPDPVVPPPEWQLRRVEAAAMLIGERQCTECEPEVHADAYRDGLPLAVGVTHQRHCSRWVDPA